MITEKQVISHLYKDDGGEWIIQTNEEHQKGVAEMAAEFAAQFGYSSWVSNISVRRMDYRLPTTRFTRIIITPLSEVYWPKN